MSCFLTCALLLALYALCIGFLEELPGIRLSRSSLSAAMLPALVIVLAIIMLASWSLGSWDEMLMLLTLLVPSVAVYTGVRELRRSSTPPLTLALFVLFLLVLGFITIISRDGTGSTEVLFGLYKLEKTVRTGSLLPMKHVAENVLLFMPFGFLWAACIPGRRDLLLRVGVYALVLSAMIESIQYLLVIGECDLEDVLANVAGAWAGMGVYRLFQRTR